MQWLFVLLKVVHESRCIFHYSSITGVFIFLAVLRYCLSFLFLSFCFWKGGGCRDENSWQNVMGCFLVIRHIQGLFNFALFCISFVLLGVVVASWLAWAGHDKISISVLENCVHRHAFLSTTLDHDLVWAYTATFALF